MDDDDRTQPPTSQDLARIRSDALSMIGPTPLKPNGEALTWEEAKHRQTVSAEDGLWLVEEVERLRTLLGQARRALADGDLDTAATLLDGAGGPPDTGRKVLPAQVFDRHREDLERVASASGFVGVALDDDGQLMVLPLPGQELSDQARAAYALAVEHVTGHRPRVVYRSWPPDGATETVPADLPHADLLERFHVGSHEGSISCRACRGHFVPDYATGAWNGRHYRLCPNATP